MKKYELTEDTIQFCGKTLHRIKALRDFCDVKSGDLGGYIENENNLSQENNAWVTGFALVTGSAHVTGSALVTDSAQVTGFALVTGSAQVTGSAHVTGSAQVTGNADFAVIKGFGSAFRTTTFFKCSDGQIRTCCGCFYGTLDEFREKVKKTHGDSKFAKEYLAIADLMEMHFKEEQ